MTAPAPGVTAEEEGMPNNETIRFSISALRAGVDTVVGVFALAVLLPKHGAVVDVEWCEVAPYDPEDPWDNQKEYYFWTDARTPIARCESVLALFSKIPQEKIALALSDLDFLSGIGADSESPRHTLVAHLDQLKRTASASFDMFGKTGHWNHADHAEFLRDSAELSEWVKSWVTKRLRSKHLVE